MRRLSRFRPSPAMVVAMVALFVAMGGASYAALGRNSVGTKQLKSKAVTTRKIKNKAVTRSKLRTNSVNSTKVVDNSLTGADINESTLGKVPNAAHADSADTLGGSSASSFEGAGHLLRWSIKLNEDQDKVVAQTKDFQVIAHCDSDASNTAASGSGYAIKNLGPGHGDAQTSDDDDADFNTGDIVYFADSGTDNGDGGEAMDPDGGAIQVPRFGAFVDDTANQLSSSFGAVCAFSGFAVATDGYTG